MQNLRFNHGGSTYILKVESLPRVGESLGIVEINGHGTIRLGRFIVEEVRPNENSIDVTLEYEGEIGFGTQSSMSLIATPISEKPG